MKERIDLLKNFGIKNEFEVIMPGINGKRNEIFTLMGQCVLPLVDQEQEKRQKIREQYRQEFQGVAGIEVVSFPENVKNSQQYMVIRVNQEK